MKNVEESYTTKIVVFLDFLGYKSIIKERELSTAYAPLKLMSFYNESVNKSQQIQAFFVSDCVFLIADLSNEEELVKGLSNFLMNLLKSHLIKFDVYKSTNEIDGLFLIRGGLSVGDTFIKKEDGILFGPNVINATELEKEAKNPFVATDNSSYELLKYKAYFEKHNEIYYFDFIKAFSYFFPNEEIPLNVLNNEVEYCKKIAESYENTAEKNRSFAEYLEKSIGLIE